MRRSMLVAFMVGAGCGEVREVAVSENASSTEAVSTGTVSTTSNTPQITDTDDGPVDRDTEGPRGSSTSSETGSGDTATDERITICGEGASTRADETVLNLEIDRIGTVSDLDVMVRVFHASPQDLELHLRRNATDLLLLDANPRRSCAVDPSLVFDDDARNTAHDLCTIDPAEIVRVSPVDALTDLEGLPFSGSWELGVVDHGSVGGEIDTWCLSAVVP